MREFGKLPSSWPPGRVGWGSALTLLPPLPEDPEDCSKIGDFIERVVVFGLDGAPVQCFSDFRQPRANHLLWKLFFVKMKIVREWGLHGSPDRRFAAVLLRISPRFSWKRRFRFLRTQFPEKSRCQF